jgi:hypothetical protein
MRSDEGRKWISEQMKIRWKSGVYQNLHSDKKKIIDRDILYDLYINQKKTLKECAVLLNTTYKSVIRNLGKYKIYKYK